MPALTITWHDRTWFTPSTVAQHSMQIPIPHSGPRGSPETDKRQAAPLIMMATAAVDPAGTITGSPFTVIATVAGAFAFRRFLIAY
jgi:hypothetical protein